MTLEQNVMSMAAKLSIPIVALPDGEYKATDDSGREHLFWDYPEAMRGLRHLSETRIASRYVTAIEQAGDWDEVRSITAGAYAAAGIAPMCWSHPDDMCDDIDESGRRIPDRFNIIHMAESAWMDRHDA